MKEISTCVKGILDAKTADDTRTIDEEIYELLKKISKNNAFESKYRDKATVLLDKVLHFNEYREQLLLQEGGSDINSLLANQAGRRMGRAAKEKVDYTSNGLKKRDQKNKEKMKKGSQSNTQNSQEREEMNESEAQNIIDDIDNDLEVAEAEKRQKMVDRTDKKKKSGTSER